MFFVSNMDDLKKEKNDVYETYGLKKVNLSSVTSQNLIIGKNGSGKTRFLKALEQNKKEHRDDRTEVITLYFPEIQAFQNFGTQNEENENEVYPYDLLQGAAGLDFKDFLKIMEKDRGEILLTIMQTAQISRTKASRDALDTLKVLNGLLMDYCQKSIKINTDNKEITIAQYDGDLILRELDYQDALGEFSPGELMLFYLCIFLGVVKARSSRKLVILMDEPELHLHPKVLVKFITVLKTMENVAELWVASHSLFLVPLFGFDEIIFFDKGSMSKKNSQIYKELYNNLVGSENIKLFDFLKSINDWEYYQFIAECFCLPRPVSKINVNDEQFRKMMKAIRSLKGKKNIQVLDYGAGKCRIWKCMKLLAKSEENKLNVEYSAFEPYPEEMDEEIDFKLYTSFEDITSRNISYDAVILMNVLHEVPVMDWNKTLSNISSILREDGILILLEVQNLANGEQPYGDSGYLVLHDKQVKLLFDDEYIFDIAFEPGEKSNCWIITKSTLDACSENTVKNSIGSLYSSSYKELEDYYHNRIKMAHTKEVSDENRYIAARKYAFLSQQFINAQFALKDLGEEPDKWLKAGRLPNVTAEGGDTVKAKIRLKNLENS